MLTGNQRIRALNEVNSASRAASRKESLGKAYKRVLKYRNKPVAVDGIRFASGKEARVYGELKLRKKAGDIKDFTLQPVFVLISKNKKFRAIKYVADFQVEYPNGDVEIWDVKGFKKDKVYLLKKKLMYSIFGLEICEK